MEEFNNMDSGLAIFGRNEDQRLPKFACGLVGCCEGKKKCCKSFNGEFQSTLSSNGEVHIRVA
jgi:hypothetical protein